jgi:hypothetical protein
VVGRAGLERLEGVGRAGWMGVGGSVARGRLVTGGSVARGRRVWMGLGTSHGPGVVWHGLACPLDQVWETNGYLALLSFFSTTSSTSRGLLPVETF